MALISLMTISTMFEEEIPRLVPYSKTLGKESGLSNTSNRIWIVMVVKVELSDGTTYDASKNFDRLKKFIDGSELREARTPDELDVAEKKLRAFVSNLNSGEPSL